MLVQRKQYLAARGSIAKLKADGQVDEANAMMDSTFVPVSKTYLESLNGLLKMQRATIDAKAAEIEAVYEHSRHFMIGLGVLVLLVGGGCSWWLTRGIVLPLGRAVDIAVAVAGKDLRSHIEVDSQDETGRLLQALKSMNDGLVDIVREVRTGTETIATASSEIAAGNLDLSSRTEQQASSLEETASSMEELTSTVKQNADNARQANQLAMTRVRRGAARRRRGGAGGRHDGRDQRLVAQDRRHHQRHRRHRLPDQYPGAERGRRSGARRRAGPRLRRRRHRGAQPGPAHARRRPRKSRS